MLIAVCILIFGSLLWSHEDSSFYTPGEMESAGGGGAGAVVLSALLPGAGQLYSSQYVKGGIILAFEVVTAAVAHNWLAKSNVRRKSYQELIDSVHYYGAKGSDGALDEDELEVYRDRAVRFSIRADQADFSVREARYRAYSAFAWMAGGYVYSLSDALGHSGLIDIEGPRDPALAAGLAAIPGLGLGQFYNGEFSKGGLVIMVQGSLAVVALNYHRLMQEASRNYGIMSHTQSEQHRFANEYGRYWKGKYDSAFSNRNTYLWYSLFFYLYSVVDAVVDAHLFDFPEKTRILPDLAVGNSGLGFSYSFYFGTND